MRERGSFDTRNGSTLAVAVLVAVFWVTAFVLDGFDPPKRWWLLPPVLAASAAVASWRWYSATIRRAKKDGNAVRAERVRGMVYWSAWGLLALAGLTACLHDELRKGTPPSVQPLPSTADEPVERDIP